VVIWGLNEFYALLLLNRFLRVYFELLMVILGCLKSFFFEWQKLAKSFVEKIEVKEN
jgi:hypothetical protein